MPFNFGKTRPNFQMEQSYRRHFVCGYFMCMATKPTAFPSIPTKKLVIYLKYLNFCDH